MSNDFFNDFFINDDDNNRDNDNSINLKICKNNKIECRSI
jgi:hypothetical protein